MPSGDLAHCLTAVLRQQTRVTPNTSGEIHLRERKAAMRVVLTGNPKGSVAVNVSKVGHSSALRQAPDSDWNRRCDYALFRDLGDRCGVVLVELKKTLNEMGMAARQLRRSLPIIKYLLSVCELEMDKDLPLNVRYALIAEKQVRLLDKQPTRPRPTAPAVERVEGIDIAIFVGKTFSVAQLAAAPDEA